MITDNFVLLAIGVLLVLLAIWIYVVRQDVRRTREEGHRIADQSTLFNSSDGARALCRAVHALRPSIRVGVDFVIKIDPQKGKPFLAEWQSPEPRPTPQELEAALVKVTRTGFSEDYGKLRLAEYPAVGDQLDAAYKARQGDASEQVEIDQKIKLIKDKYPNPESC